MSMLTGAVSRGLMASEKVVMPVVERQFSKVGHRLYSTEGKNQGSKVGCCLCKSILTVLGVGVPFLVARREYEAWKKCCMGNSYSYDAGSYYKNSEENPSARQVEVVQNPQGEEQKVQESFSGRVTR